MSVIVHRRRRQQALKATVVGGVGLATLIGAVLVVSNHDDDSQSPVDSRTGHASGHHAYRRCTGHASGHHDPRTDDDCVGPGRFGTGNDPTTAGGRPIVVAGTRAGRDRTASSSAPSSRILDPGLGVDRHRVHRVGRPRGQPRGTPLPSVGCGVRPSGRHVATDRPSARPGRGGRGAVDRHRDARVQRRDSRHIERRLRPGDRHMADDRQPAGPRVGRPLDR